MGIFTPINQVKLTNVSIVRLKKGGKRFEIACYKNKVMEYRSKRETDLENVMQIQNVFLNVSKGELASQEDLFKAFKTDNTPKIILEILAKGELQVGERERSAALETISRDVASIIAEKCIHPDTKRPYTVGMIEKAMAEIHVSIHPTRSAKQQALDIIKNLKESNTIPLCRAQMRIKITCGGKEGKRLKEKIKQYIASVEEEEYGEQYELVNNTFYGLFEICLIEPGSFRIMSDALQEESKGRGLLEVLNIMETHEGDEEII